MHLKRTFVILLAVSMLVPSIVPSVAAQDPAPPDDPEPPEEPQPPEQPDEPEPPEEPDQPDEPEPPEEPPEPPEEPPEPPEQPPEAPSAPDAENTSSPRATYFEEDFSNLTGFAQVQLEDDRQSRSLWSIEPVGHNGSMAAVLANSQGLPRGLHQGLVSPTVDLTPVPSITEDPTVTSATEAGVNRANRISQETFRTGAATGGSALNTFDVPHLRNNPLFELGPISIPKGPASLTLAHSFNFDDTRNEEGEAVSGFAIEVKSGDGEWVPVEASMLARPAHDADAPGPRKQAQEIEFSKNPCSVERTAQTLIDDAVAATPFLPGDEFDEDQLPIPAECESGSISTSATPEANEVLITAGDASVQMSTGPTSNETRDEGTPVMPNAFVQPLEQRGFTGDSDTDDDGQPEVVGHQFDLSPWAGEEIEIRFRAGTSPVTDVPGGFWALDHVEVRAGARTADLRINLTAPSQDHMAPPERAAGEDFPVQAEVQNVGIAAQQGPFNVEFTVLRDGVVQEQQVVEATAEELGFLETATAQLDLKVTGSTPYDVRAEIASDHPDQNPSNDADADVLPVGVDESTAIEVHPEASVVEPGKLSTTTVTVTPESNVPIDANLTLTAFPYDPITQLPIGDGAVELGTERIQLPRSADRHPMGVENAIQSAEFTRTLTEGAYLLVAELGEETARAPLGVGTPPPPLLSEDFSEVDPGPESFTLETRTGEWTVRPGSDVMPVAPVLDPGSVANGSAWVPLEKESTLVRPQGNENITSGFQETPNPGNAGGGDETCTPLVVICIGDEDDTDVPRAGTPLLLESPRGTQRVHAMATEVPLYDASEAQLEFLSSMIPPRDGSGLTEARVYVATDRDVQSLASQLTDPENCPQPEDAPEETEPIRDALEDQGVNTDQDACEILNVLGVDETADRVVQSVFDLEENVRCSLPNAVGSDVGGVVTNTTCPDAQGGTGTGTCSGTGSVTQGPGEVCTIDEPSQLGALAPMLSGTLVERITTPHAWQSHQLDLDHWAGQNVTLGFVFIGESQEAMQGYNLYPYGQAAGIDVRDATGTILRDPLSGKIGYGPPGHSQGAFMTSRIEVTTDEGIKLGTDETERIQNQVVNTAQTFRPGTAEKGWETIGYDHVEGLGDPQTPLRTSAQLLTGSGTPVADGAEDREGLQLGVREETREGVVLYPRGLNNFVEQNSNFATDVAPEDQEAPTDDPAVTVVASPTVDLSGTENPQIRFRQIFDLSTENGPQGVIEDLNHSGVAAALELPSNSTRGEECDLGSRNPQLPDDANVTLEGLRCLLEEKRSRDGADYDVQNSILNSSVAEPNVGAGLFVQARTVQEDGSLSEPALVQPVDGYRYPFGDAGAFEPTLNYTVRSPDSFPGYTTGHESVVPGQQGYTNQPTYTATPETKFLGTPAWAGDSDVDGDGEAEWVTSRLDLSSFGGEEVVLEFVLVARQNQEVPDPITGSDGTILSERPWGVDDVEVVESDVTGEVSIDQLRWPNIDLPVVTPGVDLPVRTTVTTPTGLDQPVHAKTVLVDADGCVRGTDHVKTQFENEAGRVEPMPVGAELDMPDMVIPGENVDGATPWDVLVGVDVGQEPSVLAPSNVEQRPIEGQTSIIDHSEALNVSKGANITMEVQDPDCEPSPSIVTVVPSGIAPIVDKDTSSDEEVNFEVELAEESIFRNENELTGDTRRSFEMDGDHAPMLLSVSQGDGSDAGGTSLLMIANHTAAERTAKVEAPERAPVGSPIEVTLDVPRDLDEAYLWSIDPSEGQPSAQQLWPADSSAKENLRATEERTLPVTLDEPGPHLLVLTGTSPNEKSVMGGTMVVTSNAQSAGDPTDIDNRAQISTIAGEQEELTVQEVNVTPSSALSTTPRTVQAVVQNTGTTTLTNLNVAFTAEGSTIDTKTRDEVRAGEKITFTVPDFKTGGQPSVVVRVEATSDQGARATGAGSVRSLVDMGSLTPLDTGEGDGWQIDGEQAVFQDPDTEEAPKDTTGAVDLVRQAHQPDAGARMEGLAGVAVQLDHTLDMEERFDGGQVILSNESETRPLSLGPATKEMGAFSPIPGQQALTGVRDVSDETVTLDASDAQQETLLEQTATEALGFPLLTDNEDGDPDAEGYATCESRTFLDDRIQVDGERSYCAHSQPAVPAPSTVASQGIFHLQPAEFLSSEDRWTVETDDEDLEDVRYEFEAREATSFVFLEAGRDLIASAQERGKMEIVFDEARMLDPFTGSRQRPMSVEVCARFMQVEDDSIDNTVRRCTGLTHDDADDQLLERDWGQTILTIGNIPEAEPTTDDKYNVVRIEFSLQQERTDGNGVGTMGPEQSASSAVRVQQPVKGWFVGPVTARAGTTSETWIPDEQELSSTDPNTGLGVNQLASELDEDDNPLGNLAKFHQGDPIEQSSAVALTDVRVTNLDTGESTTVSTASAVDQDTLAIYSPLAACPWHQAGSCSWQQIVDAYAETQWNLFTAGNLDSTDNLAAATAPYAMNLTCSQPAAVADSFTVESSGCDTTAKDLPGMGVQVIDTSTIDRGTSSTCQVDEIGPPVLWRTQCLHVRRATMDADGEFDKETDEGTSLKFTNTHVTTENTDQVPLRSRGHSLDYRLVVPVDLRFAADGAQAWASPSMEEIDDQTGNLDLQIDVLAQARIQGQENWVDVPQCESRDGEECFATWQPLENDRHLDLSEFVGQQIELALRIQHPHPMLLNEEIGASTGDEATFALHNLTVDAGYLRLIDIDMQLRGMTDPSIQGEGWNVRSVNLFGLPIQANVGLNELDSKALIEDPDHGNGQLHVHADSAAERDVYMSAPANVTVYNQGVEAQTLPLEASLQASESSDDWHYSTAPGWTGNDDDNEEINAPGECEVEIERTDPDAASTDKVHLDPGESKRVAVRVNFIPEDANGRMDPSDEDTSTQDVLGQCFPGQFDSAPDKDDDDSPSRESLDFRMRVNVSDTPEDDYVSSDNSFVQPLRPNPFLDHKENDPVHRAQLNVTTFEVDPTRPAADQPVRVSANVSLVDRTDRAADLELQLVDPASDEVLRSLSGTDADTPITTFRPYTTTTLNWTFSRYPQNETLVQFDAEIVRDGERVTSTGHGWLAADSIEDDVATFSADDFEFELAGDANWQSRGDGQFVATTAPADQDGSNDPFGGGGGGDGGGETQAVIATEDWINLEDSPPPLVAIQARWNFEGAVQTQASEEEGLDRDRVLDGWAVQVCHVPDENPDGDDCPIGTGTNGRSSSDDWAWRTVEVVRAPEDTLAGTANPGPLAQPGQCEDSVETGDLTDPGGEEEEDDTTCSAIAADWSNMHKDEDILTNTSPGFSRSVGEEGAFRTVIAPITECSVDLDNDDIDVGSKVLGCPHWNTTDRHNNTKIRLVALGSSESSATTLTVSDITLAPVGVRGEPLRSTAGEPIPEEAPKAVPMEASSVGAIGTAVKTSVDEPEGWSAQIENLPPTNAIEKDTNPRLLVEAPISPSGVSQSALLSPTFEVEAEPTRSIETLVPIGVRAGQHPDLVVEDVELSDDVKRDDEALVQVRIKNDGFETSEEVEVTGVARYDNGQVNLLEPPKDKDRVVLPSLPPGVEETVVLTWTPTESGNATVRVGADLTRPEPLSGPVLNSWDGGEVAELRECDDDVCNNVGTQRIDVRPPRVADTSVDVDVLEEPPLVVGEPVDVRITVRNAGPATVPAYEVRLLAGVVSLLEDDPLRVTEPLAPGESWSTTVEMIPGFGGDLDLVGQVSADESLVRERRGLQPGGGTFDEDNVDDQRIPVVARGLTIDVPRIVRGDSIADNGTLELPVTLRNLGSEQLSVSAAAQAEGGIGTLVDGDGDPIGTVDLAPGESQNATLLLLYEALPDAGRQPVTIDAVSKAGVERTSVEVEVPGRSDATVRPVIERASAGKILLPVTIDGEGNAPVQAQVAIQAPGLSQTSRQVEIDPNNETRLEIPAWLDASTASTVEGEVVVRSDSFTRHAPLRIVQEGDVMPTIENAQAVGGTSPHTWVRVANLGETAGSFDLALVQDNETLASDTVRVAGGADTNVTLDALPEPGSAHVRLTASATGASLNWTMDVPDLRPDVRVLHSRLDPVSPEAGETVQVQATIANEGGSAVDLRPGLFVDGVLHTVAAQERTVEPGGVTSITFDWNAEEGDHTLSVSADPQDRIDDTTASDDAMANQVSIQSSGASGALDVPFPGIGPLLLLLTGLAVLRRGRRG